ncbi:hypothetical protein NHX12_031621 [Muraenolepis orangiensis]|uniref:DSN1 n=1 Tax=Muraenolepis orangiensis TaxID=630683 RepID=A0A9Q0IHH0_9TELE|nr:hypothetical protein NHX12_031621 [Muraenolepis orangiensis]
MADAEMETKQDSDSAAVPGSKTEAIEVDKMSKRCTPTSPLPEPPCKSPRTHSPTPSATTLYPDAAGASTEPCPDAAEASAKPCPDAAGASTAPCPDAAEASAKPCPVAADAASVQAEEEPMEGSLSPSARRKSWRRSTMGRRSLPTPINPSATLCSSISLSLPAQERLEKLMEASMKLALARTEKLLQSTPNASLESFKKQAEDMQPKWCSLAEEMRSPRPTQQLPASKEKLQAEIQSWESLLTKHRQKAEALAGKVEQGQRSAVTLDPTSLSRSSQWALIQQKPDYHSVLSRQQPALHTIQLVIETQCKMVRELLSIQERSQMLVKETSGRLAADAGFQELSSDLIRSLVAVPSSTKAPAP